MSNIKFSAICLCVFETNKTVRFYGQVSGLNWKIYPEHKKVF